MKPMDYLTLRRSESDYFASLDLLHGERLIGTFKGVLNDPEEVHIPIDVLTQAGDWLRQRINEAEGEALLARIWEHVAQEHPSTTTLTVEYESEYDDQGGYFDVARFTLDNPSDDDYELWDLESEATPETLPAGEYTRPE